MHSMRLLDKCMKSKALLNDFQQSPSQKLFNPYRDICYVRDCSDAPKIRRCESACMSYQYETLESAFRPLAACCRVAESSAEPDNPRISG